MDSDWLLSARLQKYENEHPDGLEPIYFTQAHLTFCHVIIMSHILIAPFKPPIPQLTPHFRYCLDIQILLFIVIIL